MSALSFRTRNAPSARVDLAALTPAATARMGLGDIERLSLAMGSETLAVGDIFTVTGSPGERIVIEGGDGRLDNVGAGLDGGTLVVEGDVGADAGAGMKGGRLEIGGSAGVRAASGMSGGLLLIGGNAGDYLAAARTGTGERFGMSGGLVRVGGSIGSRAGDRMRRGTIVAKGGIGAAAASRMIGGTMWAEGGFGDNPGQLLRRGMLIAPSVSRRLPTFVDCGRHQLVILTILHRYLTAELGALAPKPISGPVRRFAGDMATIGKGELLLSS